MKRQLTITLSSDWRANLMKVAKTVKKGMDTGQYQGEVLNFESAAVFFGRLTERRCDLVHTLQQHGEAGVRELARLVSRDVRRVHDDAAVLLELGLIEKTEQAKLICPYADLHVDMHLKAA